MTSEAVEFYSEGYKLIGNLHCPYEGAPGVVLCHGLVSGKDSEKWLAFAVAFEEEGYAVLRFNFMGCGWGNEWSEGDFQDTTLTGRINDLRAALDFLESGDKVDSSRIGVIGSSFGGCIIIAANDSRPKAYVAMATPSRFGPSREMMESFAQKGYYENPQAAQSKMSRIKETLYHDFASYDLGEAASKIRQPLLIIHGGMDNIPVSDAYQLHEKANEPKRLVIIEGGSHTFVDSGHLNAIIDLSIGWFKEHL
jgi:dipeptidyl aminopeptidase/acylaminoacyl peptidase